MNSLARLRHLAGRSDHRLQELLRGSFLSALLRAASVVTGFLLSVLVARVLNVEQAGLFFLGITVMTVAGTLCRCGLDEIVIRHASPLLAQGDWQALNPFYGFVMLVVATTAVVVAGLLFWLAPWLAATVFSKPEFAPVLRLAALAVVPFTLAYAHSQFFQAQRAIGRFQFCQNLGANLVMIGAILALSLGVPARPWSAQSMAQLQFGAFILVLAVAVGWWLRQPPASWRVGIADNRRQLRLALPVLGVVALNMVMTWLVQLLLGVSASAGEVALYAVAFKTAMLTMIFLAATNTVTGPRFAALHKSGDLAGLRYLAVWSTRLMLAICAPLVLVMLVAAEPIMGLFGAGFVEAAPAFRILVLGQLVNVATGSVVLLLVLTGHARQALTATAAAVAVLLLLSLWWLPRYGIVGAAAAQAAAVATQMLISTLMLRRRLGFTAMNIFSRV
jgi:O-antigen/teichoic acid export membrane protein